MSHRPEHKRKPSSYERPKKPRCHHRYEPDSEGVRRCVHCSKPPRPRKKGKDPKDKVRVAARTQRRRPPPKRLH